SGLGDPMTTRLRRGKIVMTLVVTTALATAAVITGFSHEEDEVTPAALLCSGPGPDLGQPIVMPAGLIGLEIALGLKDSAPTEWEGDVRVSTGQVVAIEIERSTSNALV